MRLFLTTFIFSLFISTVALAGEVYDPSPEQQTAPQVVIVPESNDGGLVGLMVVAGIGAAGAVTAAVISTRRKN